MIRETRQVRRGGCRNDNTFRDFYFATAELIFCDNTYVLSKTVETYGFNSHISFPSQQPPTSILAYDNCHDTRILRHTVEIATVRLVERTAANPACLE